MQAARSPDGIHLRAQSRLKPKRDVLDPLHSLAVAALQSQLPKTSLQHSMFQLLDLLIVEPTRFHAGSAVSSGIFV